jgi:hypothetical protein
MKGAREGQSKEEKVETFSMRMSDVAMLRDI